jgi:hypothetical protein
VRPGWTPSAVREHADRTFAHVVNLWTKLGEFPSLGLLFTDADTQCVAVPQVAGLPKTVIPALLRAAASEHGASFVGFVAEASMVDFERAKDTTEEWLATGKPLSEHPHAVDCLVLTVDGPGLSIFARAWRDATGHLCTELHDKATVDGSMVNLSGRLGEN